MLIVWDESKRELNREKHGFDFADARHRFHFEDATIVPSYPGRDGRQRYVAVGPLDGQLIAIVFAHLGTEALSIISMRIASRREQRLYEQTESQSPTNDG